MTSSFAMVDSRAYKDLGAVESALAAPRWKFSFSDPDNSVDAADLAATYAISLARNHGFSDGNKRTAWVVANTFLFKHGFVLVVEERDAINTMLNVASGAIEEQELAQWMRDRMIGLTD